VLYQKLYGAAAEKVRGRRKRSLKEQVDREEETETVVLLRP
jgi:hypothetical protein